MRIKFWLTSLLGNIRNRYLFKNNRKRRRWKRKFVTRISTTALVLAATIPLCEHNVVAQCDE